jgi:DNA (cytosine-5)-methyltransferase 1
MRIVEICRELWGTRWTIAENVPGLFSSNSGLDFAAVVGEMVGAKFAVPKAKWQNTGVALGPRGLVEWAVLDAQWFGVPQRRRRVFLVRDSGDWRSRPPVLSFPESLQGHTPPSREKRESAPTIPSRRIAGGGYGAGTRSLETDFDCDGGLVATAFGGNNTGGPIDVATACNAHGGPSDRLDFESETFIASGRGYWNETEGSQPIGTQARAIYESTLAVTHSLRADGFDASEDGTGRGTPLVPVAFQSKQSSTAQGPSFDSVSPSLDVAKAGGMAVAFSCKDSGLDSGEISPTPRGMGHSASHANAGGQVAVAFNLRGREDGSQAEMADQASLRSASGGSSRSYVATEVVNCNSTPETANDLAFPLRSNDGSGNRQAVRSAMQVRRLTPVECCRLQGFPDDYLDITINGKPAADGNKYRCLGNSMAVPCMTWIGKRLQLVDLFS